MASTMFTLVACALVIGNDAVPQREMPLPKQKMMRADNGVVLSGSKVALSGNKEAVDKLAQRVPKKTQVISTAFSQQEPTFSVNTAHADEGDDKGSAKLFKRTFKKDEKRNMASTSAHIALLQEEANEQLQEDEKEEIDSASPHTCSVHVNHETHQAADDISALLHASSFDVGKMHHVIRHVDHKLEGIFAEFAESKCYFDATDIERELTAEGMPVDTTEITALIDRIDENDDDEITFHEFDLAIEKGTEHHANPVHKQDAEILFDLAHEIANGSSTFHFHKHHFMRVLHEVDHELHEAFEVLDDDDAAEMNETHLENAGFTSAEATEIMTAAHDGAGSHDGEISLREFEELMDEGLCHDNHSHTSEERNAVLVIMEHLEDETDAHDHGINVPQLIKEVHDVDAIIEEIFDQWDTDGDGEIDYHEVHALVVDKGLDIEYPQAEVNTLLTHVDMNDDGEISIIEFDRMLEAGTKKHHPGVHHHDKSAADLFIAGAEKESGDDTIEQRLKAELHHQHIEMKKVYHVLNPDATDKITESMLQAKLTAAGHLADAAAAATAAQNIIDACDEDDDDEVDIDEFEVCMEMGTRHHDRGHAHFYSTAAPTR